MKRNHTGHRVGEWHGRAKLTDVQVRTIRRLHASGAVGYTILSRAFGCGESTIRDIVQLRTRASA